MSRVEGEVEARTIEDGTVGGLLRGRAREKGESPLLRFGDDAWSYREVLEDARSLAAGLAGLGVEPGDRIALDLPNWPEAVVAVFAAAELGAVLVPLNPGHSPRELQFMLRNSEATAVVAPERYGGTDYLELFESLLVELPALQYLVTVGEEDLWYDDRIFQFEELVSAGRGKERPAGAVGPDDRFAVLYTPGTTGKPKGVVLTHRNLVRTAAVTGEVLGLGPEDVVICAVPLFQIFGLGAALLTGIAAGGSLVLQERFRPEEALELVERHGVTVYHGVPTMFVMTLRQPDLAERDLGTLRTGIVAGAPVGQDLIDEARRKLTDGLEIAYGLTETSPTVTMTRRDDPAEKRSGTVGRPIPGVDVRILDEEGNRLPAGTEGEVGVRGFNVMDGYFRQPGETRRAFTEDGFLRTGDLAVQDEEGYLRIVGRRSDVILRGGYGVHPQEVEDHLRSHPAVLDAAVVGVPNEVLGELVCACVQPVEGALISEDEVRSYCESALADYKVPDLVRFMEELPRSPGGKPRRGELTRIVEGE